MKRKIIEIGDSFNHLTILEELPKDKFNHRCFKCLCDCGNIVDCVSLCHLSTNKTRSCGCLITKALVQRNKTHNSSYTRLYRIWCAIKTRCYNCNSKKYKNYGKRGIVVCYEWLIDFANFQKWALENGYNDNLTIERQNNNGNYEPSNCKWITNKEQAKNKTTTKFVTAFGETKSIKEWSEDNRCAVSYDTLHNRISKGKNPETSITSLSKRRK